MGGAMLRDFAIVATAFEVDVAKARQAGLIGAVALTLGSHGNRAGAGEPDWAAPNRSTLEGRDPVIRPALYPQIATKIDPIDDVEAGAAAVQALHVYKVSRRGPVRIIMKLLHMLVIRPALP